MNARSEAFAGVAEGNPATPAGSKQTISRSSTKCNHQTRRPWIYFGRIHFGGRPRFAKINPRESAEQRSRLARLSASLRSGPGGIVRARSNASAARISQSILSGERCVSLFMVQLIANSRRVRKPGRAAGFHETRLETALFPASNVFMTRKTCMTYKNWCVPRRTQPSGCSISSPRQGEPSGSRCARISFTNRKRPRRVHAKHSRQLSNGDITTNLSQPDPQPCHAEQDDTDGPNSPISPIGTPSDERTTCCF